MSVAPEQYIGNFLWHHVIVIVTSGTHQKTEWWPLERNVEDSMEVSGSLAFLPLIFLIQKHTNSTQTQQCSSGARTERGFFFLAQMADQGGVMAVTWSISTQRGSQIRGSFQNWSVYCRVIWSRTEWWLSFPSTKKAGNQQVLGV